VGSGNAGVISRGTHQRTVDRYRWILRIVDQLSFYSKWLATKVLVLNEQRATPAVLQDDNKDYVPTNGWMVFGHHFAAIAGPGPLVGPVLAAQFGFLPGTLWILIGATLGGGVHDMIVLFASIRRGGKRLGKW